MSRSPTQYTDDQAVLPMTAEALRMAIHIAAFRLSESPTDDDGPGGWQVEQALRDMLAWWGHALEGQLAAVTFFPPPETSWMTYSVSLNLQPKAAALATPIEDTRLELAGAEPCVIAALNDLNVPPGLPAASRLEDAMRIYDEVVTREHSRWVAQPPSTPTMLSMDSIA